MPNAPAINTQEDHEESQENQFKLLLGLVFILVSPITILTTVIVYLIFSYLRVRRSVIALFSLPLFITPLFFLTDAWNDFVASWTTTFPNIFDAEDKLPVILEMLGQQFWIATPVGILVGLGLASWRWFTRARWQDVKFRKAPWEILHTKKIIKQIQNDEGTPNDGMTLGIDIENGNRVVQTYHEASGQTFLVGGSGAGKTTTALMRVRDQIKNGDGVCVVDLKGDPEVAKEVKKYCDRYGRNFKHFTVQDVTQPYLGPAETGPSHYDPLSQGDHTRRADMVLDLRDWTGADFFKKMTQSYLQLLFTVHIHNPPKDSISALEDAIQLMSPKYLQERARPLVSNPMLSSIVSSIDALNDEKMSSAVRENLQTNRSQLEIFLQSVVGPWLTKDRGGNNISLFDTAVNGDVVVFTLDSQAYPSLAGDIANLIIQDLKTVSSELLKIQNKKPFHVFIDEFSAIGSENIVGLINKARASNMFVTIATQALGDLTVKNPALQDQILGIISSFIIHRANTEEDAKVYAGLTGTMTKSVVSQKVDYSQNLFGGIGKGIGTGGGTVQEVEQWKVMPTQIQNLGVGEMYYINTSSKVIKQVQCIMENENLSETKNSDAFVPVREQDHHLSLAKEEEPVPSLAELTGKPVSNASDSPSNDVNHQLTTDSFSSTFQPPRKENSSMFNKKKENNGASSSRTEGAEEAVTTRQAFEEVKNMEKVDINYDLLRTFFNDSTLVDEQEKEDREDGVPSAQQAQPHDVPRTEQAQQAPTRQAPIARQSPAPTAKPSPFAPKSPSSGLPTRPSLPTSRPAPKATPPNKSEFDF